jgi:biotin synthase
MQWHHLADQALAGHQVTADEALGVLRSPDDELLPLLHAAFRLRERHHGRDVRIHVLRNGTSGLCPENCAFCSQSVAFHTEAPRYQLQSVEELVEGAREAARMGALKYCMVTSTPGPSQRELDVVCEVARRIKAEVNIRICTSLGLLREGQAEQLAAAGVDRFTHDPRPTSFGIMPASDPRGARRVG